MIRSSSESQAERYSGVEIAVRGHLLPSDYWHVVRASDGFATKNGFFRFFSVAEAVSRNNMEWVAAYGRLLDGFVAVAEDVFGDLYGYTFDEPGYCGLAKFFCEGGQRVCERDSLPAFLREHVLSDEPDAFDIDLAQGALSAGLTPSTDEHLAFALPLIAGGQHALENLSVEPAALHLGLLGQLSLASSQLADGTSIGGFREE